jgi:hypothetical protein
LHRGRRPKAFTPTKTSSRIGPAINLKTAKVLGIDIPAALLRRAAACSLMAYVRNLMPAG